MENTNKKSKKKSIIYLVLFLISIGVLVYFCISDNNLLTLFNVLPSLNFKWIFVSILAMVVYWFLDSRVIYHLTLDTCSKKYSILESFSISMIGQYFNSITPYNIGGQPMQIICMTKQGIDAGLACSVFIRKFLIYQVSLTFCSVVVVITRFNSFRQQIPDFMNITLIGFLSQAIVVTILILISVSKTVTDRIMDLIKKVLPKLKFIKNPDQIIDNTQKQFDSYIENNKAMNKKLKLTIYMYLLTLLELISLFLVPLFVYKAFNNEGFPIFDILSAQIFITTISSCMPLPGGTGMSEGSFFILFSLFFSKEIISSAMLIWRFITYYLNIIVGSIFSLIFNKISSKKVNQNQKI